MMWYWSSGGVHWWGWFLGFVVTVAFWALLIALFVTIFRSSSPKDHTHPAPGQEDPERVLARRFANGEIDAEEFHSRLEILRSHDRSGGS